MQHGASHLRWRHIHADVSIAHQNAVLNVAALLKDLLVYEGRLHGAAVAHTPAIRQRYHMLI